jgi:hypothetical protein
MRLEICLGAGRTADPSTTLLRSSGRDDKGEWGFVLRRAAAGFEFREGL